MADDIYTASLAYHQHGRPGKLEVVPTKPCATQRDLSLAYSPGVAEPCRRIHADPGDVYRYTNKGNLVAVVTNGTAVLGLGNIGPLAGKPVMEGKAVLFKTFADIDVFDVEIDATDADEFVSVVEAMAPTFGGINIEDVKGPECFFIERELKARLDIPVFHDDQHGTAIISAAALLNACELTGRSLSDLRCVVNGAGAAGISVARLLVRLGLDPSQLIVCDSRGVIYKGRTERMSPEKEELAAVTETRTLAEAVRGADCFMGCSVADVLTPEMLLSMAPDPIVFAMANPSPEIDYPLARATRPDVILATGRSDYPNQVNNVLGFPFIFRGALDCAARTFNSEMMLAAVRALAELAKEEVPRSVARAYGGAELTFGREYLIPKPLDGRVLSWVSPAVAAAAAETGVARRPLDIEAYTERLRRKVQGGRSLVAVPMELARENPSRIAIPEGHRPRLAALARRTIAEGLAFPVLIGPKQAVREAMQEVDPERYEVVDPADPTHADELVALMHRQRPLDTLDPEACRAELANPFVRATLLCEAGRCDGLLAASPLPFSEMVRPILRYSSRREGVSRVAGLHLMALKDRNLFFADTTLIPDPSAEELAEIALRATRVVQRLNIVPRVAFVAYTNFATRTDADLDKLRRAYKSFRLARPDVECFGAVQADVALDPERFGELLAGQRAIPLQPANILIFPNLHAANAAFAVARVIGQGSIIGPMLLGLRRPANVMPYGSSEEEVIHMMAITAYNAQRRRRDIAEGRFTRSWRPGVAPPRVPGGDPQTAQTS